MPQLFLNKFCDRERLIQFRRTDDVAIISQRPTENPTDRFMMADLVSVGRENLLLAVSIGAVGLAAGVTTKIYVSIVGIAKALAGQDAGPGLIDVDITGVVEHVSREPTRRAHVYFQGNQVIGSRLAKKFEVEEAFTDIKRFEGPASEGFYIRRDFTGGVIVDQVIVQDCFHDPGAVDQRIRKDRPALPVRESIKGNDLTTDKFLQQIIDRWFRFEE